MRTFTAATAGALAAAGAFAVLASGSGGPPPSGDYPPEVRTVVARGTGVAKVAGPARRTNRTIERAVRQARRAAMPKAVNAARKDAQALAAAAGLQLAGPIGAARDAAPLGYWEPDTGRFGPGRWCGRITTRKTVRGSDGDPRRVTRSHHGCPVPSSQSVRVTVTFAVR
jgi:hypothetical protein